MKGILGDLLLIALFVAVAIIVLKILRKFKVPKIGTVTLITGGVKSGKSTFAVNMVLQKYKQILRRWKIRSFFQKRFGKKVDEKPLLYSNIPLTVPYVPITEDLLLRKKRFRFNSCVYIGEASLVADSQLIKNMNINQRLLLFNKLVGHSLHGNGYVIYDSQSYNDLHYSCKRVLSSSFYIHHTVKIFPFFLIVYLREERYDDMGNILSVYSNDVEDSLKKVLIHKNVWKKFDSCCYSTFTDDLPVEDGVVTLSKKDSLKANEVVTFRDYGELVKRKKNEESVNENE